MAFCGGNRNYAECLEHAVNFLVAYMHEMNF